MLPGIGGIAGRAGGNWLTRYTFTSTASGGTSTLTGGTVPNPYSAIEYIAEGVNGKARSVWTAGEAGAPTPGAALNASIDRTGSGVTTVSSSPSITLQATSTGATGGKTNDTSGTAWRWTINYIP